MVPRNPHCEPCIYYGKSTGTCDYILIAGHRRLCDAGNGCTRRITRKEIHMKKAKWDTDLGRMLWLEGKSDGEIADELHVATCTVTSYRKRHWELELIRKEDAPPVQEGAGEEPRQEPMKEENVMPEAEVHNEKKALEVYDILEAAVAEKKGIMAICTADAILCLWDWKSGDDLLKARSSIDYLLRRLDG